MRRRQLLAGLGAVVVAGCGSRLRGSNSEVESLTPAPVPAVTTSTPSPARETCPRVPTEAELYVCPPKNNRDGLLLTPDSRTYNAGTGGLSFTLRNGSSLPFHTGRTRWTVANRGTDGWGAIDRGTGTDRLFLEPGESFVWTLNDESTGDGEAIDVAVGGGPHAFAVTGAIPRGRLIAVVAQFDVEPSFG